MNVALEDAGQSHLVRVLKQIFPDENILQNLPLSNLILKVNTATSQRQTAWRCGVPIY